MAWKQSWYIESSWWWTRTRVLFICYYCLLNSTAFWWLKMLHACRVFVLGLCRMCKSIQLTRLYSGRWKEPMNTLCPTKPNHQHVTKQRKYDYFLVYNMHFVVGTCKDSNSNQTIRLKNAGLISRNCRSTTNHAHCSTKNFNCCAVIIEIYFMFMLGTCESEIFVGIESVTFTITLQHSMQRVVP